MSTLRRRRVNTASIRPSAAYAAAKGGVIAFTKSLAREVSPAGVRANCVSPGPIDTPMLQAATPEQRAIAASRTLLGRLGTARTTSPQAVRYLASDESAFVTGGVLRVNGGSLLCTGLTRPASVQVTVSWSRRPMRCSRAETPSSIWRSRRGSSASARRVSAPAVARRVQRPQPKSTIPSAPAEPTVAVGWGAVGFLAGAVLLTLVLAVAGRAVAGEAAHQTAVTAQLGQVAGGATGRDAGVGGGHQRVCPSGREFRSG